LEITDQVAIQEHVIGFTPATLQCRIRTTRSSVSVPVLVGTQPSMPEVLDGVKPLDDHFLTAHGERALGETDGDDHRSIFGSETQATARAKKKAPFQSCLVKPLMKKPEAPSRP